MAEKEKRLVQQEMSDCRQSDGAGQERKHQEGDPVLPITNKELNPCQERKQRYR